MPISHRVAAWLAEVATAEHDGGYAADATMRRSDATSGTPASWSRDIAAELRGRAALWLRQPDTAADTEDPHDDGDHSGELRYSATA